MSDLPPANWYPDPEVPGQQRYWDGTQWTEHRAAMGPHQPTGAAPGTDVTAPQHAWDTSAQSAPAVASTKTNGLAIASLAIAILSFVAAFVAIGAIGGAVAVVLGIIALRQVKNSAGTQSGRGVAIGGIALGGVAILLGIVVFAFFAAITTAIQQGDVGSYVDCVFRELERGGDPNVCLE